MSVRTSKIVMSIVCGVLIVMMGMAAVWDDDPKVTSSQDLAVYAIFLATVLGLCVFAYFNFRCPQCGHHLSRPELSAMKCNQCGCALAEAGEASDSL